MFRWLDSITVRRAPRVALAGIAGLLLLGGCCSNFYYDCAPQQPAAITAREDFTAFQAARDQTEGLLSSSNEVFTSGVVSELSPRYTAAANAANGWVTYAGSALRGGTFSVGESDRMLGDYVSAVTAFADAVEGAAGDPHSFRRPFQPLPQLAIRDDLTAQPPIIAAAEQVKNGAVAGAGAIGAAQQQLGALTQQQRDIAFAVISETKWRPAADVLAAPIPASTTAPTPEQTEIP